MEILEVNIESIGLNVTSPTDEEYKKVGEELFNAFETIGFVFITGHGVSKEVVEKSMETSKDFFTLPLNSKNEILRDPEIQQGYVAAGQELFNSKLVIKKLLVSKNFVAIIYSLTLF
jgi:isopenicillin N synthase-like dioxygenase